MKCNCFQAIFMIDIYFFYFIVFLQFFLLPTLRYFFTFFIFLTLRVTLNVLKLAFKISYKLYKFKPLLKGYIVTKYLQVFKFENIFYYRASRICRVNNFWTLSKFQINLLHFLHLVQCC